MPYQEEGEQRLEAYPQRFRARVAGQVSRVVFSAAGQKPSFQVTLLVEKSKPLPPAKTHPMTGMPIAETGEDLDDTSDVSADSQPVTSTIRILEPGQGQGFTSRYSVVHKTARVLYPDYPPLAAGSRLKLIWLGQRQVPGIEAGGYLRVSGLLSLREDPVIYNPRYEIVSTAP